MAKQNESAVGAEGTNEAPLYINDEVSKSSKFGWFKSKSAKITAAAVAGALALGAAFAGGAVAGQVASHNNGPAIGAPFNQDDRGHFDHGKGGFDRDGDGPHGQPPLGQNGQPPVAPNDQTPVAPDATTQTN